MADRIRITLLADHVDAIPQLAEWFEADWAPYYGPQGQGEAQKDLQDTANRDILPIALVALVDNVVCGTAALKMESVATTPEYSPWLAALLVGPAFRGLGVSRLLIDAVTALAAELGFQEIYCGTDSQFANVELPDWTFVKRVKYFVSDAEIYRKALG